MAAPNLRALTTVTGKSSTYACSGTLASALDNPAASGKVLKINSIRAANVEALGYTLDVSLYNGTTHAYICKNLEIGSSSSVVLLSRDEYLYIEEGESIYAKANSPDKIDLIISYEELL